MRQSSFLSILIVSTTFFYVVVMTRGGTSTNITISGNKKNKELQLTYKNCPKFLDLTNLKNGAYSANMISCGL